MAMPRLGVQSWCFRKFPTAEALAEAVKALGLREIELCDVHLPWDKPAELSRTLQVFRGAGIAISSIGVQYFANQPEREERWFAFAQEAGAQMMAISFSLQAYDTIGKALAAADKLAEKYGLLLGIHNHGGYDWLGNKAMVKHVFGRTSEHIGLCLDTAWCLQAGESPVAWAAEFSSRLFGIHLKDFAFDRLGKPQDVVLGDGALQLAAIMEHARTAPRLKTLTLEYEGDADDPVPKLKECAARVREVAAA